MRGKYFDENFITSVVPLFKMRSRSPPGSLILDTDMLTSSDDDDSYDDDGYDDDDDERDESDSFVHPYSLCSTCSH